jgi:polysaccharide export outer membrane protein
MWRSRLVFVFLMLPMLSACVTFDGLPGIPVADPTSWSAPPLGGPITAIAIPSPPAPIVYTLDAGDRLRVVVFGQDGLTNSYSVDAAGNVTMPLIGAVQARGRTTAELSVALAARLRQGYIREPHVAVEVELYRPFFILGEVVFPGQYPYVPNMTVETAVAIAGGFTPRAFRRNLIVNRVFNGRPMRMTVPLTFPLRPGDTVNVQERWF